MYAQDMNEEQAWERGCNRYGGMCFMCKGEVKRSEFRDTKSVREYSISGLCMHCQDLIFGEPCGCTIVEAQ